MFSSGDPVVLGFVSPFVQIGFAHRNNCGLLPSSLSYETVGNPLAHNIQDTQLLGPLISQAFNASTSPNNGEYTLGRNIVNQGGILFQGQNTIFTNFNGQLPNSANNQQSRFIDSNFQSSGIPKSQASIFQNSSIEEKEQNFKIGKCQLNQMASSIETQPHVKCSQDIHDHRQNSWSIVQLKSRNTLMPSNAFSTQQIQSNPLTNSKSKALLPQNDVISNFSSDRISAPIQNHQLQQPPINQDSGAIDARGFGAGGGMKKTLQSCINDPTKSSVEQSAEGFVKYSKGNTFEQKKNGFKEGIVKLMLDPTNNRSDKLIPVYLKNTMANAKISTEPICDVIPRSPQHFGFAVSDQLNNYQSQHEINQDASPQSENTSRLNCGVKKLNKSYVTLLAQESEQNLSQIQRSIFSEIKDHTPQIRCGHDLPFSHCAHTISQSHINQNQVHEGVYEQEIALRDVSIHIDQSNEATSKNKFNPAHSGGSMVSHTANGGQQSVGCGQLEEIQISKEQDNIATGQYLIGASSVWSQEKLGCSREAQLLGKRSLQFQSKIEEKMKSHSSPPENGGALGWKLDAHPCRRDQKRKREVKFANWKLYHSVTAQLYHDMEDQLCEKNGTISQFSNKYVEIPATKYFRESQIQQFTKEKSNEQLQSDLNPNYLDLIEKKGLEETAPSQLTSLKIPIIRNFHQIPDSQLIGTGSKPDLVTELPLRGKLMGPSLPSCRAIGIKNQLGLKNAHEHIEQKQIISQCNIKKKKRRNNLFLAPALDQNQKCHLSQQIDQISEQQVTLNAAKNNSLPLSLNGPPHSRLHSQLHNQQNGPLQLNALSNISPLNLTIPPSVDPNGIHQTDSREKLSALGVGSSLRSDVLYKTIIRDMRKYYSKDFNSCTLFIKRKRYKTDAYILQCIQEYLEARFKRELGTSVFVNGYSGPSVHSDRNSIQPSSSQNLQSYEKFDSSQIPQQVKDIILFLGCLLYPKDIELATKGRTEEACDKEMLGGDLGSRAMSFKTIHTYLYSFSLEKLNNLINLKYFAFFFCHYFKYGILQGNRLQRKPSMRRHLYSYTEACNLILTLCQETLRLSISQTEGIRVQDDHSDDALAELISLQPRETSKNEEGEIQLQGNTDQIDSSDEEGEN